MIRDLRTLTAKVGNPEVFQRDLEVCGDGPAAYSIFAAAGPTPVACVVLRSKPITATPQKNSSNLAGPQ
jgi:hypothetical protein